MENQENENQEEPLGSAKIQTKGGLIAQIVFVSLISSAWLAGFNFWYLDGMSYQESYRWPFVTGEVLTSEVGFSRNEKSMRRYYPQISYRYVVNGDTYENDLVELVQENQPKSAVTRFLRDFRVGEEVLVYHHRDDPQKSLLVPGDESSDFGNFLFYTAFMGIFALIIALFAFGTLKSFLIWKDGQSSDDG